MGNNGGRGERLLVRKGSNFHQCVCASGDSDALFFACSLLRYHLQKSLFHWFFENKRSEGISCRWSLWFFFKIFNYIITKDVNTPVNISQWIFNGYLGLSSFDEKFLSFGSSNDSGVSLLLSWNKFCVVCLCCCWLRLWSYFMSTQILWSSTNSLTTKNKVFFLPLTFTHYSNTFSTLNSKIGLMFTTDILFLTKLLLR